LLAAQRALIDGPLHRADLFGLRGGPVESDYNGREQTPLQVIDPATWDRDSWFACMGEHAAEMIAAGAAADLLTRFEASTNQWLAHQGVPNPPFRIIDNLPEHRTCPS
jgi:hypothetical protein